ncbi:unnamed protein product [Parnassius mnemosyne]|uniref:Uncharacterized protein n=1 Tax=Parnassius mnemosyne TaxID=213953 RepID=A0AAV1M6W7_9NEOP
MGSRARMLVKLCEQECSKFDSIGDQSLPSKTVISTSANEIFSAEQNQDVSNIISNIDTACSSQPSIVTENVISSLNKADPSPILLENNENDSEDETKDFSPDDSGDEYKPEKSVQRNRINSTSSNSSSGSSCSTSSSSSSGTTSSSPSTSITHDSVRNSNFIDTSQDLALPSETAVTKRGKKRVRNESAWIKNVRKRQRNSGEQYVSRTGKTVAAKSIKPPCTEKCRLKCRNKITEEQRQEIFECYWGLGSLQRQRDFLNSCLITLKVPYRRVKEGAAKARNQNCVFNFTVNGETKRTCKTFFLNSLGISERTLRTVIEGKNSSGTGVIPQDKRGKHAHHNQVNPEIMQSVRDHINSVPRIESHYTRANTTREFIDGGLTVKELHRNYVSSRGTMPSATFDTYYRIFNTEFNLSFFVPKKDQCDLCESYKNAVGKDQLKLKEAYEEHLKQKDLSRKEKTKDIELLKEDGNNIVAIYDLQAVMPVPIGNSSAFFYKSKLNCLNFTVSILFSLDSRVSMSLKKTNIKFL